MGTTITDGGSLLCLMVDGFMLGAQDLLNVDTLCDMDESCTLRLAVYITISTPIQELFSHLSLGTSQVMFQCLTILHRHAIVARKFFWNGRGCQIPSILCG